MILDLATILLVVIGALFALLAGVGILRMPDVFTRMHASSKAGTAGAACMFAALAFHFATLGEVTRSILVVLFLFLTAPVAAHLIGRASYFVGTRMWDGAVRDDLEGRYDHKTHSLRGEPDDEKSV